MREQCVGNALVTHWQRVDNIYFVMENHRKHVGNALATCWQHVGNMLVMRWQCVGNVLAMRGQRVGNAWATQWLWVCILFSIEIITKHWQHSGNVSATYWQRVGKE